MTIQDALEVPGPLVAAWDLSPRDNAYVAIYSLAGAKPRHVLSEKVSKNERAPMDTEFQSRGVRVGSCAGSGPFVWVQDDLFTVFSESEVVLDGMRSKIVVAGREIEPASVQRVVTFVDEDDWGHRGVRLELRDQSVVGVAEERDRTSTLDPTYGWDNVLIDALWASVLGKHLASWLGVPHVDQIA